MESLAPAANSYASHAKLRVDWQVKERFAMSHSCTADCNQRTALPGAFWSATRATSRPFFAQVATQCLSLPVAKIDSVTITSHSPTAMRHMRHSIAIFTLT